MSDTLAILVGGGPAPGINGVIAAATIEATRAGLRVVGLYDGYRHIARGDATQTVALTPELVAPYQFAGGSLLRTSRTNPGKDEATLDRCVAALATIGARYLVTIGGDDTTYGASRIAARTVGTIAVASVPKTIDNDLPLPGDAPTFGYETARAYGASIVENLLEDARTTGDRWYVVVAMGRKSGSLTLGIGTSAGASLAIIPEELPAASVPLAYVVDTIVGSILKSQLLGRSYGVAMLAEGIAERIDPRDLAALDGIARDAYGHVRLADLPLGTLVRDGVRTRLAALGADTSVVSADIGYELRCAKPVAFDAAYTRALGTGAVRYLLDGGSGALIALSGGHATPLELDSLLDPATARIRVRLVDTGGATYGEARGYMTRLETADLDEPARSRLAAKTNLAPDAFADAFAHVFTDASASHVIA